MSMSNVTLDLKCCCLLFNYLLVFTLRFKKMKPSTQSQCSAVSPVTLAGLRADSIPLNAHQNQLRAAPIKPFSCLDSSKSTCLISAGSLRSSSLCLFNPVWLSCRLQSAQCCHGWNGEGLWKAAPGIFPGATHSSTRLPRQPHVTHWSYVNGASALPSLLDVGHRPTFESDN